MTPAEREQVVDLLRAAEDYAIHVECSSAIAEAAIGYFGESFYKAPIGAAAMRVVRAVTGSNGWRHPWSLLEAARRVEEEGWEP